MREKSPRPDGEKDRGLLRRIARELATILPRREAKTEAARLLDDLLQTLPDKDFARARAVVSRAVRRWQRRGLPDDTAARATLALIAPKDLLEWSGVGAVHIEVLRAGLDALPVPLILSDSERRILICNEAFDRLLPDGVPPLEGLAVTDVLAPDSRAQLAGRLTQAGGTDDSFLLDRVRFEALPGLQFVGSWMPFRWTRGNSGWLLRLTPENADTVETLGERLRQEQTRRERFTALLKTSNAVMTSLELDQTLDTIVREARRVIQVDECTVYLLSEAGDVLIPAACDVQEFRDEIMALRLPIGQGVTGYVAQTGQGRIVNDALSDPHAIQVPGTPVEQAALLSVPLLVREKVAGVITLTRVGDRAFCDEDLELVTLFAGQCSAAIANARLYDETRRAYEELRETQSQLVQSAKLNALGEMAGGVAHDFNNILAAILGRTQLLLQNVADDDTRAQLEVIEQATLDGAQAVRRVQEFTRLRQDEHFDVLDVREVLSGILELTRPAWEGESKRRGITLTAELDLHATQPVSGNASELREVFTNLVLNALDAMPWGGRLTLSSEDVGEEVCIRVVDTGVGMDADTLTRIFDPFFTTKLVKGTGLGLSVAYGIITRHHGRITVESEPGRGSTFSVWLPAATMSEVECDVVPPGPLPRLRVLAVDDEETVLRVLGDLLTMLGQDVVTAPGGAAGLERFASGRFDVVFTDLGMPEVNGWDLARAVKSRSPATPVVFVTGWGAQIENRALDALGVDHVVPKPFSLDDVRDVLLKVAGRPARAA